MPAGRPPVYTDDIYVRINAKGEHKLQAASDRRAIIDLLVNNRGRMTMGKINAHFGFDITTVVSKLQSLGWVEIEVPE